MILAKILSTLLLIKNKLLIYQYKNLYCDKIINYKLYLKIETFTLTLLIKCVLLFCTQ